MFVKEAGRTQICEIKFVLKDSVLNDAQGKIRSNKSITIYNCAKLVPQNWLLIICQVVILNNSIGVESRSWCIRRNPLQSQRV